MSLHDDSQTPQLVQIFFASGILGGVFSCSCLPGSISSGASGALYGIYAAHITQWALNVYEGDDAARAVRMAHLRRLGITAVFWLIVSFAPIINWAAHIFGFISGIVLAVWIFGGQPKALPWPPARVLTIRYGALISYFVLLLVGLVAAFASGTQPRILLHLCEEVIKQRYPDFTCYSP